MHCEERAFELFSRERERHPTPVIGVKAFYDGGGLRPTRIGVTCALCHSTVNDALTKGIGNRLDGWPNRDLDVGSIVALSPRLTPFEKALNLDSATIRKVLHSWGPGKYDAELIHDGKAFRPDGKSAATLLPAAFGLAGVNRHTYTGWGSVTHWNAYVANTQMHGRGTFVDARLNNASKFPIAPEIGIDDFRRCARRTSGIARRRSRASSFAPKEDSTTTVYSRRWMPS